MKFSINFDMDGTLAALYSVPDWLEMLRASDPSPYSLALPMVDTSLLTRYINKLNSQGWEINIITWGSKRASVEYLSKIQSAKITWLEKYLPHMHIDNFYIVPYGTPKHTISRGILFDDELKNRIDWNQAQKENHAFDESVILTVLAKILNGEKF